MFCNKTSPNSCVNPLRSLFRLRKSLSKTHSIYDRFPHFLVMYTQYLVALFLPIFVNHFCSLNLETANIHKNVISLLVFFT